MYSRTAGTYDVVDQTSNGVQSQMNVKSAAKRLSTSNETEPITKQSKITEKFRSMFGSSKNVDVEVDALSECSSDRNSLKQNSDAARCESRGTISSLEDDHVEQSFTLHFHQRNDGLVDAENESDAMIDGVVRRNPFENDENFAHLNLAASSQITTNSLFDETKKQIINGPETISECLEKSLIPVPPDKEFASIERPKYIVEVKKI